MKTMLIWFVFACILTMSPFKVEWPLHLPQISLPTLVNYCSEHCRHRKYYQTNVKGLFSIQKYLFVESKDSKCKCIGILS